MTTYTRVCTPGPDSAILQQVPCPCCSRVGPAWERCGVCRRDKAPMGRSIPLGIGGYCDDRCTGYATDPWPDSLWPGERWEDSLPCMGSPKCVNGLVPHPGPHLFTFSIPVVPSEVGDVWALAVPCPECGGMEWNSVGCVCDRCQQAGGGLVVAVATVIEAGEVVDTADLETYLLGDRSEVVIDTWLVTLSAARWLPEPITDMECPTRRLRVIGSVCRTCNGSGRIPLVVPPVGGLTERNES
jgi:hypothetical protein